MNNTGGGPPSIADFARQKRHEEYNAALQASLPPSRSASPVNGPGVGGIGGMGGGGLSFAAPEFQRGHFPRGAGLPTRAPHFQRRTLLDTFVERDDTYWVSFLSLPFLFPPLCLHWLRPFAADEGDAQDRRPLHRSQSHHRPPGQEHPEGPFPSVCPG